MIQTTTSVLFPPILLATDGSPSASFALALVRPIAHLFSQQISQQNNNQQNNNQPKRDDRVVLSVLTVKPRTAKEKSSQTGADPLEELANRIQLNELPREALSLQVRQGRPTSEILNYARTIEAGLIAVGYRGGGGVRELLLGSVSTTIARYAPCSVLIARGTADAASQPSLQRVLLVVENAPTTQQAIATAQQLIPAGVQQITLLSIQPALNAGHLVGPFASSTPSWQLNQSLQTAQKERGEQLLQQAKNTLHCAEITLDSRIQTGDPGPTICQVAQEAQANLVILGSDSTRRSLLSPRQAIHLIRRRPPVAADSRPILRNTRLSITEDYVIHYAPCPVLLCRSSAK
jgi:nucleotide-binding universal stress UspA family protein